MDADLNHLPLAYRLTRLWGQFQKFYQRVEIEGLENIPTSGPLLVVSNHMSYFDPLLISAFFPRVVFWMAKAELFKKPWLRKILINNFVFPAARGEKSDIFLKGVAGKIQKGQAVGIFIQGSIQKPGEKKEAKKGAATLAAWTGCSVVLVQIQGTRELYSLKTLIPKSIRLSLKVSSAFHLKVSEQVSDEELFRISNDWLKKIESSSYLQ